MLRPERMSKVSVTGSKPVMDEVIEAIHDLNLVHLSDYDGSWEGFEHGNPVEGAEEASQKLVTVRALKSLLDVDESDAGPRRIVTDEALETELERVREEANELDDRRTDLQREIREIDERIETMVPFVDLGIDLDLLRGYDSLDVAVGEGERDAVEAALADAADIETFETFGSNGVVAVFASPADDAPENVLDDVLVGTEFTRIERPDAEGDPEQHVAELEHRKQKLQSRENTVEEELHELKLDAAGFLLAAEERLSIQVQKTEAPLQFATTENAFVAEGWIPTDRVGDLESTLRQTVGDRVDVEELERADYDDDGLVENHEAVGEETDGREDGEGEAGSATEESEPPKARADGGVVSMGDDDPPIIQNNPDVAEPFEAFVRAVGVPNYSELDPTVILLLTFPAFFGFMIGDVGYGLLYAGLGVYIYRRFESAGIRSMGGIAIWAGAFTVLFGVLYGEIFGTHQVTEVLWKGIVGLESAPIHKGLVPAESEYALLWFVVSLLAGLAHLTIGYAMGFVDDLVHGVRDALLEDASWLLMMIGVWTWVLSTSAGSVKPPFLVGPEAALNGHPIPLGFAGFPASVGLAGLGLFALGIVMLGLGEPFELVEFLNVFVNVVSYVRLMAVLLAKAGMAFVVNLLFFGVGVVPTEHGDEWHFLINEGPDHFLAHHEGASILFAGLAHSGIAAVIGGIAVLLLGHVTVLALGVTSAGLQAVRLEYVEFFGKFYQGNGRPYDPFGYDPEFTSES
ncbi:MAG: V-type ATP synthase subunit I [Halanaeroarchaeum sp.]